MKKTKLIFLLFAAVILASCSNTPEPNAKVEKTDDEYGEIRAVAWDYLQHNDWHLWAKKDWENAIVEKIIADHRYELLDPTIEGKEVLRVSFEDRDVVIVGTPTILIDPQTKEVVGYMLGE
ncbi:MAG TPA: hypothetical protein VNR38_08485 [Ureibacillus sp.]|nr:hypothetical protein [Ureibacillus sp.]